jgi:hypothetical protein
MTFTTAEFLPTGPDASTIHSRPVTRPSLRTYRLNLMRAGYLFTAVGLAVTKWPLLGSAASLPAFEGVVTALLTAMSLLAFLGLRYPVRMLPLLMFESLWKIVWLGAVGIPHLVAGDMNPQLDRIFFNVSFVVVILAVTPWDFVWKRYVRAAGDPWR